MLGITNFNLKQYLSENKLFQEIRINKPGSISVKLDKLYEKFIPQLEEDFDTYQLTNFSTFEDEVENGDLANNLSYDIAEVLGFKGSYGDFVFENYDFHSFCNTIALYFMLKYGVDKYFITQNDPRIEEYKQDITEYEPIFLDKLKFI